MKANTEEVAGPGALAWVVEQTSHAKSKAHMVIWREHSAHQRAWCGVYLTTAYVRHQKRGDKPCLRCAHISSTPPRFNV